ncbi:hypothetical protein LTR86_010971 [Recurvomyces mirabilis]|nr:hypothetical protein LTR86_010971 [Recurvomyces mirabilis]
MRTAEGFIDGRLDVTPRTYVLSNTALKAFDYQPIHAATPRQLIQRIGQYGLQEYTFTDGGIGCRYWTCILSRMAEITSILFMYMLERTRIMPAGTAVSVHKILPFYYSSTLEPRAWPIQQGTFGFGHLNGVNWSPQDNANGWWREIKQQVIDKVTSMESRQGRMTTESQQLRIQHAAMVVTSEQGHALEQSRRREEEEGEEDEEGEEVGGGGGEEEERGGGGEAEDEEEAGEEDE